jgi:hypothetical protein
MVNLFSAHDVSVGINVVDKAGVTNAILALPVPLGFDFVEVIAEDESKG